MGVAIGSVATCVAITGGLALHHLGSASASSTPTTTATTVQPSNGYNSDGFNGADDNGFPVDPFANNGGGADTTSHGS